ncbi:MAG: hypothetical protein ACJZ9L_03370 [Coraliomargaritaceae bacterium]
MGHLRTDDSKPILQIHFLKKQEAIIANFLGSPQSRLQFFSKRSDDVLRTLVVLFVERYDLERPKPEQVLVESWDEPFSGAFLSAAIPIKLTDSGTLIVSVTNSTLRAEIIFKKNEFLHRIKQLTIL